MQNGSVGGSCCNKDWILQSIVRSVANGTEFLITAADNSREQSKHREDSEKHCALPGLGGELRKPLIVKTSGGGKLLCTAVKARG